MNLLQIYILTYTFRSELHTQIEFDRNKKKPT